MNFSNAWKIECGYIWSMCDCGGGEKFLIRFNKEILWANTRTEVLQIIKEVKEKRSNSIDLAFKFLTKFPGEILELDWLEKLISNLKNIWPLYRPIAFCFNALCLCSNLKTLKKIKKTAEEDKRNLCN